MNEITIWSQVSFGENKDFRVPLYVKLVGISQETMASRADIYKVHNCRNFGDHHRRRYATIPPNTYGNFAQDIDLITAEQMHYEARKSPLNQMNISRQQSILSNVHQPINCEETVAAERISQCDVTNQYRSNPETSDILFPDMHPIQENKPNLTSLQMAVPKVFINQNLQNFQPSNSEHRPKEFQVNS
ncbi:hypothetical protein CEXT_441851 [Caerostris extrusa]|uniref:Uncharacterized protein n=1 Tax=Caerostris extrusa TaxID=172846 RepID=A0AAV4VK50_CAEEX|nr:hypothetical protein CEXT_441851 [Caerostris extrusa]